MNHWKQRSTLVIGGAGFCGAHLCEQLIEQGARVTVLDPSVDPHGYFARSELAKRVHFQQGDILDLAALKLFLERFEFDTIFLLAAQPIVSISNALPLETAQINIIGTYNVLEAIRLARRQPKLVFASSGAYYGATQTTAPIPEDAPALVASNIYAPTKAAADLAVRCYARLYHLQTATCRWMNTYGPGDTNFTRIVPATIRRLMNGEPALIDGTDGSNVLEVLHVRDMAAAYLAVAENLERENVSGEAFNFGGGAPLTLRALVVEIIRAWNAVTEQSISEEPLITGPHVDSVKYLDITKARAVLGWRPRVDLQEGLQETVRWYLEAGPSKHGGFATSI
jgi:CDP-glucose 4,6-dehydratase